MYILDPYKNTQNYEARKIHRFEMMSLYPHSYDHSWPSITQKFSSLKQVEIRTAHIVPI